MMNLTCSVELPWMTALLLIVARAPRGRVPEAFAWARVTSPMKKDWPAWRVTVVGSPTSMTPLKFVSSGSALPLPSRSTVNVVKFAVAWTIAKHFRKSV